MTDRSLWYKHVTAIAQTLKASPLFSVLGADDLETLAALVGQATFAPGQVIVLEGNVDEALYFIARGVVRVRQCSNEGREHVLAYLGPGYLLNLVPALDGGASLATADALTHVVLYTIPVQAMARLLRDHPALSLAVAQHLAQEVRRLTGMVKELALHTVRARLARFLLDHAESRPSQHRWTQEAIAAAIGTVRDVVGRTLRDFAEEGWIRRERGRLVVVDRDALEREARGG